MRMQAVFFECARISFYAVEKDNKMLKMARLINVYDDYDNKLNNMITHFSLKSQAAWEKNNWNDTEHLKTLVY